MLKSTHIPVSVLEQPPMPPLPSPWTEHLAPSGHQYYYNPETKQSTYIRPVAQSLALDHSQYSAAILSAPSTTYTDPLAHFTASQSYPVQFRSGPRPNNSYEQKVDDRSKSKHAIPGCTPWLLIKTRLGRRFVHNPSTNESFWKFPKDVIGGVVEFDIQEREKKLRRSSLPEPPTAAASPSDIPTINPVIDQDVLKDAGQRVSVSEGEEPAKADDPVAWDEEYEEVEVTDEELEDDGNPAKRLKASEDFPESTQIVEFGEEDMARQLAAMGQIYQLEPGEYGRPEDEVTGDVWEEGAEGLGLTEEEAAASFGDLLDEFNVDPYTLWETVVSEGYIIEDDRYTLLPNMKRRREVFTEWSIARIQQRKVEREKQLKQDPRVAYLAFLAKHATPKLFWPEFRRKYKKDSELKDPKLSDKDRETLYRNHITRITKHSEEGLKTDLVTLLQSIPVSTSWSRSTSLEDGLPPALLADVRFISLKPSMRDAVVQSYIAKLPRADAIEPSSESTTTVEKDEAKRQQELALDRRGREIEEAKRRQHRELQAGERRLREQEQELSRAMHVGKQGLLGHVESEEALE